MLRDYRSQSHENTNDKKTTGNHWVWFEVLDLDDCIINKLGPDRAVLWGLAYTVE